MNGDFVMADNQVNLTINGMPVRVPAG